MGAQDVGDLEKIRKGIEGWLSARLPDRGGISIPSLEFPKASGESSVTLILEARSKAKGDERFVLRMPPPISQVFDRHDLKMQFDMMTVMAQEKLPAPPLVGYESDASILGSDFYVMGFRPGRIPPDNPPMMIAGWLKDETTPAQRTAMWTSAVDVLARIHRIDLAKHDFSRLPRAAKGEPLLAQEMRTFDAMFKPEIREAADSRILEGWEFLRRTVPTDGTPAFCWGDSRVGNIIFDEDVPAAILDWEMANVSDPRTDLAWFIWIDRCNSEGLGAARLPGIPSPESLFARWAERTGRSIRGIEWFELFAVVRYAIILERKFAFMRESNPGLVVPNFPASFIPGLMKAVGG
ncbi:phosphotransferase family protein [Myxococcota bacterium]|nr:phosphotransferase family protein [Myxococcota bacterium]